MGRAHGGLYAEACDAFSCEPDSPMGQAHGGLYAEACDALAARLIHPWDKPMGVCMRKRATVIDWPNLSSRSPGLAAPASYPG